MRHRRRKGKVREKGVIIIKKVNKKKNGVKRFVMHVRFEVIRGAHGSMEKE